MKLKDIAKLCKARGIITLTPVGGTQWIGDLGAAFPALGMPFMDEWIWRRVQMPDYIDRDKLLEAVEERNRNSCTGQLTYQQLKSMIENFSAADVMEVTRCKDCEHSFRDPAGLCCSYGACLDCLVPEYYFCFHGEKRRSGNDKT